MATFVNSTGFSGSFPGSRTPITSSYTAGTGTNRMLVIGVFSNGSGSPASSGVTYGGVAMTVVGFLDRGPDGSQITVYALVNAPTGANNFVLSCNLIYVSVVVDVLEFAGFAQSVPTNYAALSQLTSGSSSNMPITTLVNNSWAVCFLCDNGGGSNFIFNTGTKREQYGNGNAAADSNGPVTPAGTYTFNANSSSGDYFGSIVVELPVAAAAASLPLPVMVQQSISRSNSY